MRPSLLLQQDQSSRVTCFGVGNVSSCSIIVTRCHVAEFLLISKAQNL